MDELTCPRCGGPVALPPGADPTTEHRCIDPACDGTVRDNQPGSLGGDNGGG
ncbi:hypothetical protein [Nocardioides pacificus]